MWPTSVAPVTLNVEDGYGRTGTLPNVALGNFQLVAAGPSDPQISEYALMSGIDNASDPTRTTLQLDSPLTNCYDRASTTVNANVGAASAGRSVSDILGNRLPPERPTNFYAEAVAADLCPSQHADRLRQHASAAGQRRDLDGGPDLYGQLGTAQVYPPSIRRTARPKC